MLNGERFQVAGWSNEPRPRHPRGLPNPQPFPSHPTTSDPTPYVPDQTARPRPRGGGPTSPTLADAALTSSTVARHESARLGRLPEASSYRLECALGRAIVGRVL
jgi:hypothetical protein